MRRSFIPILSSLLLPGIFTSACSSGGQGSAASDWVAVYDTIGDTIVVRTVSGSLWKDTAQLVPEISIGVFDGPEEYIFGQVVGEVLSGRAVRKSPGRHDPCAS